MTVDDVKKYFNNGYEFARRTDMCRASYQNWIKRGYIPIATQVRLERITEGGLKADLNHVTRVL
jgi:hypothetical protein